MRKIVVLGFCLITASALSRIVEAQSDVVNTKHNLSTSGPGEIKALTENRICVFCHTPHNGTPQTPLWNKELQEQNYDLYTSTTLKAGPLPTPTGPTKLCLSCHDGTIALGAVVNPSGSISMAGGDTFPAGSLANFGLNLASHHPVSFPYSSALPNPELANLPPQELTLGGTSGEVHCTTCHDPHKDTFGKFLLKDNRFSALCTSCHQMTGWEGSAHATSTASVVGILPIIPKTWPTWTQLNEWGCEVCHTPHFASTPEALLNFTDSPPTPFACTSAGCHSSEPPPIHTQTVPQPAVTLTASGPKADIAGQIKKASAHHQALNFDASSSSALTREQRASIRAVSCADCHNPHRMNRRTAEAPNVPGFLQDVSGVDRNGSEVPSARYEYEVCFKCHSDFTSDLNYVPRVMDTTNTRVAFDPSNESYHPVVSIGRNLSLPSIPSTFRPTLSASNMIYCSDCHADDEDVSKGPHGSTIPPILKERYEIADNTPESYENYALCYRCHNRDSILNDASFRKKSVPTTVSGGGHSGHLNAGVSCAACHDPHGVKDKTHLINFDARIVLPIQGAEFPVFRDTGNFSGTCTLECHGVVHDNYSYP